MANAHSQLDLSQLAVERTSASKSPTKTVQRPSRWLTRYVAPGAVVLAFIGLFVWSARSSLLPAQRVTVTPVVVTRSEIKQEGTPLFQAAGWVEPRPMAVTASALTGGVIDQVHVIEGQHVARGEPVATLIDTDAKIALAEAEADLKLQEAELRRAEATLTGAKANLAQPVQLQAELANADAELRAAQTELHRLPFEAQKARTQRDLAEENNRSRQQASGAIAGRLLRESAAALASAESTLAEVVAREPQLRHQIVSLQQRRDALDARLRLMTEETRAAAEADANLAAAKARLDQSRLRVDTAKLRLERMQVRSPIDGCVLSVEARPGQWVSGAAESAGRGGSAVAGLYDPKMLQVRVDVRLEDVPQVVIGQPAEIETAALGSAIEGQVVSITTFADIQKNTLQVKVAVIDPPAVLKPEMLAKVTFLAPPSVEPSDGEKQPPLRLFIPKQLVSQGESGSAVWTADLAASTAVRKGVSIGGPTADGLVEVISGLTPTDKLIVAGRESLSDGARVLVVGEDSTWGDPEPQPELRTAQAE
ncbi:efflux RND transporter periplasmic adaptor subunit [Botrimarina mediterranea]|jgi:RND family efflux transporter MFP subunit|uniref:efflux RND transporter periplasmic adaptor subunit n=1 Tax=Botrimarina mediterranea TaxID=2528022 RepID=UPI00118A3999|nr:multidrug resistance protein MdtN [Planctomycetes bacterium K2D]